MLRSSLGIPGGTRPSSAGMSKSFQLVKMLVVAAGLLYSEEFAKVSQSIVGFWAKDSFGNGLN